MNTIGISCSYCNTETTAEIMSATHANCFVCAKPHSITENEYEFVKRDITPLHDIIEQRAKDKAVIDMWLEDMPFIDWSTCFDTGNITNNNICDCTAPQVDEDKMCICGLPITAQHNWTNDSGYSDVFQ